ncbi:RDD family protein [Bacillus sp. IB182487]|uniref:RDD family protein n=1 Tax=Metabacillus arenae TaxID=2771434 RepID=A0A926NR66_9BACI|nr:RDD family protein [Metabacillus arenae]
MTDENGNRIGLLRSLVKFFSTFLSTIILFIGYLMVAFHPEKRALHDLIAGTYVMKSSIIITRT